METKEDNFGLYEGQVLKGQKHGLGRFTNQGTIFEGEFRNDLKSGKGRLITQQKLDE